MLKLDQEGDVSRFQFIDMAKQQPLLLYPAYLAQSLLRERVVGNAFWFHISRERQKNFPGSADIWKILNEDNPWADFSGSEKEATVTKHVPEPLKKYCPTKFTRDDYVNYKQAEIDGARQMRVALAKEEGRHLAKDEIHHKVGEWLERQLNPTLKMRAYLLNTLSTTLSRPSNSRRRSRTPSTK